MTLPDVTTRYPRLASWFYGQCWALAPESLLQLEALLQSHMAGWRPSAEEVAAATGARRNGGSPAATGVAVLPVRGVISPRAELLTESSGGTSVEALTRALRRGVADPEVGAIVLDVDSPGGSVFGIEELAAEIAAANRQKPIVAVANASAASAAYWLASQASELSVTPSGEVGSIGVLALHEDVSGLQAQKGVATTLVTAGTFKAEGNPFEPLGAEGRNALQARVDEYYGAFSRAVAHGRHAPVADVRGGMGEGRMVGAREAVRLGMADRVETLDQAVVRVAAALARGERPAPAAAADAWLPPLTATDSSAEPPSAADMIEAMDPLPAIDVAAGPRDGASPTPPVLLRRRLLLRARAARYSER